MQLILSQILKMVDTNVNIMRILDRLWETNHIGLSIAEGERASVSLVMPTIGGKMEKKLV